METEHVWCDIDLETIEEYEPWRLDSLDWYDSVDWELVTTTMRAVVAELAAADQLDQLLTRLSAAGRTLSKPNYEGLFAMWREPITATAVQITNGGHRITAMRKQGVRWAIGMFTFEDVGESVDPIHAYLPTRR